MHLQKGSEKKQIRIKKNKKDPIKGRDKKNTSHPLLMEVVIKNQNNNNNNGNYVIQRKNSNKEAFFMKQKLAR